MRMLLSLLMVGFLLGLIAPAGACPVQADDRDAKKAHPFRVHFRQSPGVPDFRSVDIILDSKELTPEQVKELRKLIEEARFFELKSSLADIPLSRCPDPPVRYSMTVEMDGRKHVVEWDGLNERKELQPLVDCVRLIDLLRTIKEIKPRPWPELKPLPELRLPSERLPLESRIKVHYFVSGGIAGGVWVDLELDARHLSGKELLQLEKLIDEAGFFDLPRELPITGADIPGFTLTVEMDGRKHTVRGMKIGSPKKLQPLLDCLDEQARKPRTLDIPFRKPLPIFPAERIFIDAVGEIEFPDAFILEGTPDGVQALVFINGQTYWLDLGKDSDLLAQARKLKGKKVSITGWLEYRKVLFSFIPRIPHVFEKHEAPVIVVSRVEEMKDAEVKPVVRVEITGTLERHEERIPIDVFDLPGHKFPPKPPLFTIWQIKANGRIYHVQFANKHVQKQAEKLVGQTVVVSGTLDGDVVTVTSVTTHIAK